MAYKAYIDGYFKLSTGDSPKWHILEAMGKFFTKTEADKQAAYHLKNWEKMQNDKLKGTSLNKYGRGFLPYPVRSRIIKAA